MLTRILIIFIFLSFVITQINGQAIFSVPDTVCIDDTVVIKNESGNASTYYWNFCSGNLAYNPEGENLGNLGGTLDGPAFIDFADDGTGLYALITNHNNSTIVRNTYGDDFLSTPLSENLGSFGAMMPQHIQGIQIVTENGNWYAFIVGGQRDESRLVRLDFGSTLSNNPTAHIFGNIGALDYPMDLFMVKEGGNWYGFTVNLNTNTITRLDFGNNPENTPSGNNLGNIGGLDRPTGIFPIKIEGNWHLFISNYEGHQITRLDFGSSITSTPTGTNIGDPEFLYYPFDMTIIRDCERIYGFVLNRFNDIVRMEFNQGIDAPPDFTSLGEIGNLYNPHGISDVFRVGDTLYTFVANIDNSSITRLYFPGCNNANPASSTDRDPPPVVYNQPGTYNISLALDEGTENQDNYCKDIVVLASPDLDLGNDTTLIPGSTIELEPDEDYAEYEWSNGESTKTISVDKAGSYKLRVTNEFGCTAEDEIEVILDIGVPNFFTPNGDDYNDKWEIPFLRTVPDAHIQVFDRFGNLIASFRYGDGAWDGTKNGQPVKADTYWYIIDTGSSSKPFKGSVTIKR